jgi:hypothetical protein
MAPRAASLREPRFPFANGSDEAGDRSSNWIEQGTPKAKVVSSILTGRTNPHQKARAVKMPAAAPAMPSTTLTPT